MVFYVIVENQFLRACPVKSRGGGRAKQRYDIDFTPVENALGAPRSAGMVSIQFRWCHQMVDCIPFLWLLLPVIEGVVGFLESPTEGSDCVHCCIPWLSHQPASGQAAHKLAGRIATDLHQKNPDQMVLHQGSHVTPFCYNLI